MGEVGPRPASRDLCYQRAAPTLGPIPMLIVECRLISRPRRAAKDTKYILHQQLIVRGGQLVASRQQTLPASIEFRLFLNLFLRPS
eukprot:18310_2